MAPNAERILVVESDPEVSDLIARQALQPLGYEVKVVGMASQAIQQAVLFSPDLIIASFDLADLSGKDLLVALSSQGLEIPAIMIADKGREGDVIQAYRLGAADYLSRPIREAELVQVVERALKQVRARRERNELSKQLEETNKKLQRRIRELTTIYAIGKAVTSITDQGALFDRIVEGAVYVTEAHRGWLLIWNEQDNAFQLRSHHNLPEELHTKLNKAWDDGISSLVALSGETLVIHGDPLKRFKIAKLGQSALVVPVKVQKETIGLLVVLRKEPIPFSSSAQSMLEAVADYASISLMNAQLFRTLEQRARTLQEAVKHARESERIKDGLIQTLREDMRQPVFAIKHEIDHLLKSQLGELNEEQIAALAIMSENLDRLIQVVETMQNVDQHKDLKDAVSSDLNALALNSIGKFQRLARREGLTLKSELSDVPAAAQADPEKIAQVLDGLLANAIKFTTRGGQITLRIKHTEDRMIQVSVQDSGVGIPKSRLAHVFERDFERGEAPTHRYSSLGIRLFQMKEIIEQSGGKIWVESLEDEGSTFHFTLHPEK